MAAYFPSLAVDSSLAVAQELPKGGWEALRRVKDAVLTFSVGYLHHKDAKQFADVVPQGVWV